MISDSNDVSLKKIQDPLSCVALRISMYFNSTKLATGTAFIYLYEEKPYLITNWHNYLSIRRKAILNNQLA